MRHIKSKAHSSLKRTPFTWIRGKLPLSQHGWKTIDLLYSTQMMGPVSLDIKNVHLGKELRNFLCDATRPYVSKHLYVVGYASSNCHANTIHVKKQLFGRDYQNGQDLWHFRPPNFSFCKPLRQYCRYALFSDSIQTTEFPAQANQLFSDSVCVYDNSWITHIVQLWWEPGRYLDNYGYIWMMFVWTTPTLYVSNFCTNT